MPSGWSRFGATSRAPASAFGVERDWLAERVSEIVHGAASVSFELPLPDARAINVEGTRRVLEFAERCQARGGLRRFSYISTAYVAGEHAGCFSEDDLDVGQRFRNAYEQSKFEAESLLAGWRGRLPITVLRPSIIVGERDSGWTASFNVLYWPLRAFARGAYPALPARRDAPVDVVPVDYVADAIFALSQAPEAEGATFHLTAGAHASSVGELVELASAFFERPAPRLIDPSLYRRRGAPAARCARPATSATAKRWPQRGLLPVLRDARSPTTIVAPAWRCGEPASGPRRCATTSTGSWSSRSPPSGDAGRARSSVASATSRSSAPVEEHGPRGPRESDATAGRRRRQARGPRRAGEGAGSTERSLGAAMTGRSRLSALDASFLAVETPTAHMHVGWAAAFSAPADGSLPSFPALRDHIELRLGRAPRYRQKLAPLPLGLHAPEWIDDPAFSVDRHVYRAPGPLHELVDEVMSMPLRRDRPLWEIWICEDSERRADRPRRQAPSLHGRRHRGRRARLAAARPDA